MINKYIFGPQTLIPDLKMNIKNKIYKNIRIKQYEKCAKMDLQLKENTIPIKIFK